MNRIFSTLIMLFAFGFSASAQWITGMSVVPANPTIQDNVSIIATVEFPSGDCQEKTLNASVSGMQVNLSALHCVGMLTFICGSTDTFQLGQLAAGTYTVYFQLDMGAQPYPCTPDIVPGAQDSMTFIVTTGTGLPVLSQNELELFPNPGSKGFTIRFSGNAIPLVRVTDVQGRIVREFLSVSSNTFLDLSELKSGAYMVELYDDGKWVASDKWIKN
jgi:hypothetical protein